MALHPGNPASRGAGVRTSARRLSSDRTGCRLGPLPPRRESPWKQELAHAARTTPSRQQRPGHPPPAAESTPSLPLPRTPSHTHTGGHPPRPGQSRRPPPGPLSVPGRAGLHSCPECRATPPPHTRLRGAPQRPVPRPQTPAPVPGSSRKAARPRRRPSRPPRLYRVAAGSPSPSPAGPEVAAPARKAPGWSGGADSASCSRQRSHRAGQPRPDGDSGPAHMGEHGIRPGRRLTPIVPPAPPTGSLEPSPGPGSAGGVPSARRSPLPAAAAAAGRTAH